MWKKALIVQKNAGFLDQVAIFSYKNAEKDKGHYPAIFTKQPWPMKDFLYGQENFFLAGLKQQIPSGQDARPMWPTWVANQNTGFTSSCPLTGAAM